jgi:hypothetical protein
MRADAFCFPLLLGRKLIAVNARAIGEGWDCDGPLRHSAWPSSGGSAAIMVAFRTPRGLPGRLPDTPFWNRPICFS